MDKGLWKFILPFRLHRLCSASNYNFNKAKVSSIKDAATLLNLIWKCFNTSSPKQRHSAIKELLNSSIWFVLYRDSETHRKIYAEKEIILHSHEMETAKALCAVGFDVLFAPDCLFSKTEKRFDVFLIRDHIILKAELKNISSKKQNTIAKRVVEGSEQSSRLVLNILSNIERKTLIDGLQSGTYKNEKVKEILLFYNSRFYRLRRGQIISRRIFNIIK